MNHKKLMNLFFLILAAVSLAASASTTSAPVPLTSTPVPLTSTPVPPTGTPAPPTDTPAPPTSSPTPEISIDLQMEIAEGDPLRGRNTAIKYRCYGCHVDPGKYGPHFASSEELPRIMERGELRIADPAYEGSAATNRENIIESIFLPETYILPGEWEEAMLLTFHLRITDTELANIMAWLSTLE